MVKNYISLLLCFTTLLISSALTLQVNAKVYEKKEDKQLRYAQSLVDRGKKAEASAIIDNIIENSKDNNAVAKALYYKVIWKFASDEIDTFEKLKAFYPDSKYIILLEKYFKKKEQYKIGQEVKVLCLEINDGETISKQISVEYPDHILSIIVKLSLDKGIRLFENNKGVELSIGCLRMRIDVDGENVVNQEFEGTDIASLIYWKEDTNYRLDLSGKYQKYRIQYMVGGSGPYKESSSGVVWTPAEGWIKKAHIKIVCIREEL
ncbi:MAG: hypothetical protein ABII64_02265 [Elusimicrobiota bacterium]